MVENSASLSCGFVSEPIIDRTRAAAPTFPTGMITVKDAYGWDFRGFPYAGILHWFPDFEFGKGLIAAQKVFAERTK